jgi:hypothetical protein
MLRFEALAAPTRDGTTDAIPVDYAPASLLRNTKYTAPRMQSAAHK